MFPHRLPATAEETARRFGYFPWMDSLTAEFALEGRDGSSDSGSEGGPTCSPSPSPRPTRWGMNTAPTRGSCTTICCGSIGGWESSWTRSRYSSRRESTLVVLTADHGVQSLPEFTRANRGKQAQRVWLGDLAGTAGGELASAIAPISI